VLIFAPEEKEFRPSEAFINDSERSSCPFIIMLVGNRRARESAGANQLVKHQLQTDDPFEALNGSEPVTMKFQFVDPMTFRRLAIIHNFQFHVDKDPDIR
jgi:septin family protein